MGLRPLRPTCAGCGREIRLVSDAHEHFTRGATIYIFHPRCRRDVLRRAVPASPTVNGIALDGPL